jgi:hypothetical protein
MADTNGTGTVVSEPLSAASQEIVTALTGEVMDKFGRTDAERTITLEVDDAERIGLEVEAGSHQAYDDALHYVIERGVAEIKRQRESLKALKVQRDDARAMSALRTACANNPELMTNPVKLADVMKTLGIKLSK